MKSAWHEQVASYGSDGIEWSFEHDANARGRFRIKFGRQGETPVISTVDLGRRLEKRERGSSGSDA